MIEELRRLIGLRLLELALDIYPTSHERGMLAMCTREFLRLQMYRRATR